jgi:hypothetical protein
MGTVRQSNLSTFFTTKYLGTVGRPQRRTEGNGSGVGCRGVCWNGGGRGRHVLAIVSFDSPDSPVRLEWNNIVIVCTYVMYAALLL